MAMKLSRWRPGPMDAFRFKGMKMGKYKTSGPRCCGLLWYVMHAEGDMEVIDDMFPTKCQAEVDAKRRNREPE